MGNKLETKMWYNDGRGSFLNPQAKAMASYDFSRATIQLDHLIDLENYLIDASKNPLNMKLEAKDKATIPEGLDNDDYKDYQESRETLEKECFERINDAVKISFKNLEGYKANLQTRYRIFTRLAQKTVQYYEQQMHQHFEKFQDDIESLPEQTQENIKAYVKQEQQKRIDAFKEKVVNQKKQELMTLFTPAPQSKSEDNKMIMQRLAENQVIEWCMQDPELKQQLMQNINYEAPQGAAGFILNQNPDVLKNLENLTHVKTPSGLIISRTEKGLSFSKLPPDGKHSQDDYLEYASAMILSAKAMKIKKPLFTIDNYKLANALWLKLALSGQYTKEEFKIKYKIKPGQLEENGQPLKGIPAENEPIPDEATLRQYETLKAEQQYRFQQQLMTDDKCLETQQGLRDKIAEMSEKGIQARQYNLEGITYQRPEKPAPEGIDVTAKDGVEPEAKKELEAPQDKPEAPTVTPKINN